MKSVPGVRLARFYIIEKFLNTVSSLVLKWLQTEVCVSAQTAT